MSSANPSAITDDVGRSRFTRFLAAAGVALLVSTLAVFAAPAEKAEAAAPGPKDAIAVLFSYTWNAIAKECTDTLGPAGYGYVQTSPPQEHVLGQQWWTYYQPVSYKLESRMGTEAEFAQMVSTCNAAGVEVIVDAVINHMSGKSDGGTGWAGTQFQHYSYPGLYTSSDFHSCRRDIGSYQNRYEVQECNLVNLSDLNTSSSYVQTTIAGYLNKLVDLGVAGFRFDAVKHIAKEDMWGIWNKVTKKDSLYVVQEVIRAGGEPIQPEEYIGIGDIHEFAFARKLKEAFGGSSINWLISGDGIGASWPGFLQNKDSAVFVDNHDTERNGETLSYKNGAAYDLAQIFTLAWNYGSPSIHSGYEFSDKERGPVTDGSGKVVAPARGQNGWTFKHAQTNIANMVGFRNTTYGTAITNKWDNGGNAIAFGRGSKGYVAINNGGGQINRTFTTSLPDGEYYNVTEATKSGSTWSGPTVVVSGGKFTATVGGNKALALHVDAKKGAGCTDAQSPSMPGGVQATANGTSITVAWSASTDDCGIAGYEIVRTGGGESKTLTTSALTITDTGLTPETSYSYSVRAKDTSAKLSASTAGASATTGAKPVGGSSTVFYSTEKNWSTYNVHYQVGSGAWTTAPGKAMTAACAGWVKADIDLGTGTSWKAAFNNGSTWDSNGGNNYTLAAGIQAVKAGAVTTADPCGSVIPENPLGDELKVYYSTTKNWANYNAHYRLDSGAWTTSPGKAMTAACTGWVSVKIPTTGASSVTAAFNNGSGAWDNNGGKDYIFKSAVAAVNAGAVTTADPCGSVVPETPLGDELKVYYSTTKNWANYNAHYRLGTGTWTTAPGKAMTAACTGWVSLTIPTTGASSVTAAFNNGTGTWDNNGGKDYTFKTAAAAVNNGAISTTDPCPVAITPSVPGTVTATATANTITVSWTASTGTPIESYLVTRTGPGNTTTTKTVTGTTLADTALAYNTSYGYTVTAQATNGKKSAASAQAIASTGTDPSTTAPGIPTGLTATPNGKELDITWNATPGATKYTVVLAAAGQTTKSIIVTGTTLTTTDLVANLAYKLKVRASNDAGQSSAYTEVITATTGTGTTTPTPTPTPTTPTTPAVPIGLIATPDITSIALSWTASTGATKYTVSYTTGSSTKTVEATATQTTLTGLAPNTAYAITVSATGAGGTSAPTAAVTSKTLPEDELPPVTTGSPLGGDPREDSIYFMMTARWNDGDTANNMGGSQHVKSGNAANNDPMFRGDFKGVIDKLDYVKGLGFSAIWITPVVLNRSDYDFHGYHGWDFQRIDPRLESPGASYQQLIDAAHAKGIKIYQDVVYNHTSRWGEKNLFVPTVYGTRDAQWSWYYDEKIAGKQYDPSKPDADGSTYTGDLWSQTQPAGQNCANFGTPAGYSAEGYRTYNCQWPNATSGMFPKDKFHPCWIGNWEGKDAQDCWIHEDLADLNTESKVVQDYLIETYNRYIDMGVDGFRVDTAVHIPRVMWNRHFLPALQEHAIATHGEKGKDFYVFGEVAQFVHDKWNRGSVNHSAPFYTWKERKEYSLDDVVAAAEQFSYENLQGPEGQPTTDNAVLRGNTYHVPDHSKSSGMSIIDMRMHMNFDNASNAFHSGMDSDSVTNDATFNAVYVDSHDYGPGKSQVRFDGGTDAWAENLSLMWTFRGVPTLFYGSEVEFQAGKKIDCGPTCPLATTGRAYFGDQLAGTVVASDFGKVTSATGAVAQTFEKPLVKHIQTLNQVRRAVPALQKGQYSREGVSGDMAFKRRFTEGSVDSFVLVTISGSASFTGVPNGTYTDAVTGDVKTVSNGSLSISANGKGNMRAYVLSLPGNPAPGKVGNGSPFLK